MAEDLRKGARLLVIGVICGFFAGVTAVTLVVWQFGNIIGTKGSVAERAKPAAAIERWDGGGAIDADSPVLEAAVGTAGDRHDAPAAPPVLSATPESELDDRQFAIPVEGIGAGQLVRSFDDDRGNRKHEAIDILAPMGTPVRAIEDGRIARLFVSKAGGITVYQFDPSERYSYYYAHLQRYADGLRENDTVKKGQVIGYVGVSGNAPKDTPHLHFAIYRLTEEKRWWEGTPIDPYDVLR